MNTFYFIVGGGHKKVTMPNLKKILDNAPAVYDFYDINVPENADQNCRKEFTEQWLQKLLQENKYT